MAVLRTGKKGSGLTKPAKIQCMFAVHRTLKGMCVIEEGSKLRRAYVRDVEKLIERQFDDDPRFAKAVSTIWFSGRSFTYKLVSSNGIVGLIDTFKGILAFGSEEWVKKAKETPRHILDSEKRYRRAHH